jgi:lysophospholipase L1-like esterase
VAKIVAIGDSLTQGAQSFAVSRTDLSYPAMVADRLGLAEDEFIVPDFSGVGGLPFNLERMARELERSYGDDISLFEWIRAAARIASMLDEVEDYWERGDGSQPDDDVLYHNLAVWNFKVCDAYSTTSASSDLVIGEDRDEVLSTPSHGRLRIARRVLNPAQLDERANDTQIDVARRIRERDGSIDHLFVALGANNCLRSVLELDVRQTGDITPGPGTTHTLWSRAAFAAEYDQLARGLETIGATNVYLATVPRVTLLPVLQGVGGESAEASGYREAYTYIWIDAAEFDSEHDRQLSGADVARIDRRVDAYNEIIRQTAETRGWRVVDLCALVDGLAGRPLAPGQAAMQLPQPLAGLDIGFFGIGPAGNVRRGGLISLDGMHPTTCAYGMFAQAFVEQVRQVEPGIADIDFEAVRGSDELVGSPPRTIDDVFGMLRTLEERFHVSRWLALTDEAGLTTR